MIEILVDSFLLEFEAFLEFLPRLLLAVIVVLLIYYIGRLLSSVVVRILKRTDMPETYHQFFRKLIIGISLFFGFVLFLNLIGYTTLAASLVAGGGLTAVMLGFAFKDIGENFIAGFFLAFSRPFNTNDVIESGGIMGRVKSIELRHTHIRTSDGCDVFVPSVQLFTKPLHNYTLDGLRRGNFSIGIDYGDDAEKALDLLEEATRSVRGVLKNPKVSVQIRALTTDYVELQVHFWISARDQELTLPGIRSVAMNSCRLKLIETGYTLSSDTVSNIHLKKE
jgi:small-conductance mechanosensitive channel